MTGKSLRQRAIEKIEIFYLKKEVTIRVPVTEHDNNAFCPKKIEGRVEREKKNNQN